MEVDGCFSDLNSDFSCWHLGYSRGLEFQDWFFVHVPTSLEEGVLQDPTLNLLIYHFVKSSSYVLVQFL